jgi:hypothetical protein
MAADREVWDVWLDMVLYCGTRVLSPRLPHGLSNYVLRGESDGLDLVQLVRGVNVQFRKCSM